MLLTRLPYDLVDLVVGVVAAHDQPRQDLLALARVCYTLSAQCRRLIFREIELISSECVAELVDIIARDPAIPGYIKNVKINCDPAAFSSSNSPVFFILGKCPGITALNISLGGSYTELPSLEPWHLQLPLLRHITVQSWQPIPLSIVEALLSSCMEIENLCVSSYGFSPDSPFAQRRRVPVKRLTLLVLAASEQVHVTRLGESVQWTQELVLYLDLAENFGFARAIIATVGRSLQLIELCIKDNDATPHNQALDLSACMNLRDLRLSGWEESDEHKKAWVGPLLESLSSCPLEHVVLNLVPGYKDEWERERLEWPRWERALSSESQYLLRTITLSFMCRFGLLQEVVEDWFPRACKRLPVLDARGLLQRKGEE